MKFVFVSHNYSPDIHSPQDWFERIKIYAGSLACLSKTDSVTRIERIDYTGSCLHDGIQYHFGDYGKGKLIFPWKLHHYVRHLKPDIVVVAGLHYPLQVIQLRLRLGWKVKIIAQHHAEKPFTGIKKYLQRLADHFIDAYFFSSKAMGGDWVRKGNLGSLAKIHEVMEVSSVFHPTDRAAARSETGMTGTRGTIGATDTTAANGNPVFLWVGRLDENKNPLMVVRSFLHFAATRSEARLYMIYHTTELLDEIERLLDGQKGGSDAVVLVGAQPHARMGEWYNSADFIISGSWYEGSSTAVCEAMSCGCIPIVTDIFSFRMMTGNGRCGLLYEAGNGQALLGSLERAEKMDMTEERRKVLEQYRSSLSFEAIAGKIREVAALL
jgi:glycosyltransferase involved in cell wall biosynthesis